MATNDPRAALQALRADIRAIGNAMVDGTLDSVHDAITRVCYDAEQSRLNAEIATDAVARFAEQLGTYRTRK